MVSVILTLGVATALFISWAVGQRMRNPAWWEVALVADLNRRRGVAGLYILGGPMAFIATCANVLVPISNRYNAPVLDLRRLWWMITLALVLAVVGLHLSWLVFDLNTIGTWTYMPEDRPLAYRLLRTGVFLILAGWSLYVTCDWARLTEKLTRTTSKGVADFMLHMSVVLPFALLGYIYGNNGLNAFLLFPQLVRAWGVVGFVFCSGLTLSVLLPKMGADLVWIFTFACTSGLMAWLVARIAIESLANLWYYQRMQWEVVLVGIALILVGVAAVVATPFLAYALLSVLEGVLPAVATHGWAEVKAGLEPGLPLVTALCLVGAAPLVPVLKLSVYGMGAAIGNRMPMMPAFVTRLSEDQSGPEIGVASDHSAIGHASKIMEPRREAYAAGYALATLISLCWFVAALGLAGVILNRLL